MIHSYRPFLFWCQKVLPLVYDNSLSYYEVLCKLVKYLNELMENMKIMGEDIEDLQRQITELDEYVKNYFSSADFQELVNNALDEMADDGTLTELLESHVNRSIPITANGRIINAIWDTAKSYMDNETLAYMHLLIYKDETDPETGEVKRVPDDEANEANPQYGENAMNYNYGPYYGVAQAKKDGSQYTGWAINCSGFAQLLLLGVPFLGSMYNTENGRHNKIGMAGYEFNMWNEPITAENYDLYYRARDMARRMRDLGCGFYANANYSNIAPGDIIFFASSGEYDPEEAPTKISHCGIVLAKTEGEFTPGDDEKGLFITLECINQEQPIRTRVLTSYDMVNRRVRYIGRPAYIGNPENRTYKICDLNGVNESAVVEFTTASEYMNQYPATLAIEYKPNSVNDYIRMRCTNQDGTTHTVPFFISEFTKVNANEVGKTIRKYLPFRMNTTGGNGAARDKIKELYINNPNGDNDIIKSATLYYGIYDGATDDTCIYATSVNGVITKLKSKYGTMPNNSVNFGKCTVVIDSNDYTLGLHHFTTSTVWKCEFESGNDYTYYYLNRGRYKALIILHDNDVYTWCNYPYEGTIEDLDDSLPRYGNPFPVHITLTDEGFEGVYDAIVAQNEIMFYGAKILQYRRSTETVFELTKTQVRPVPTPPEP